MSRPFDKVLIANRGEIACRVIRTCRRLGIATVGVYSDADANALHVRSADAAIRIGPAPAQQSYLSIERILAAAKQTGAQAIHPGYGFLSENEDFAEACAAAGVTFIGPPASAIRAMGSKSAAKALMQTAGVPLTPGYHGDNQNPTFLQQQADSIGYPLLIKASAGGGGKGMRRVDASHDFAAALASCKREAASSFGDDHVLLERYILSPRHIEIQIFADSHGNVVSLFERDCSVQRRHQKVLEEAPAPGMTLDRRAAMSKAATDAARSVGYTNAGTVEFIADQQGNFFFMEMNTRLQVEHPVTECITGLDLVGWQLRIAAGEPLPFTQDQLNINGHAIEARIYAEDPAHNFLPSIGKLVHLKQPAASQHVRIDTGVEQGDEITAFYDPMIAKLIVWDHTRDAALAQMQQALANFQVVGVKTNITFLQRLITSQSFTQPNLDTALIEREAAWLNIDDTTNTSTECALAALTLLLKEQNSTANNNSPWMQIDGWRLNSSYRRDLKFTHNDTRCSVQAEYVAQGYRLHLNTESILARATLAENGSLHATLNGSRVQATVINVDGTVHVFHAGHHAEFMWLNPLSATKAADTQHGTFLSPMPGRVTAVLVAAGDHVQQGTPLMTLEAMKMEYTIYAPANGYVQAILFEVGDQAPEATQLLTFEPDTA